MKKKVLSWLLILCMVLTAIPFSMVSASAAEATNISMSGMTYPSGTLNKGDLFVLRGTISANKNIQRIEIGIVKDGKWVAGHKVDQTVNSKSFNVLQKADSKIKFGDLSEGNYSYRCWVWIDGKSNRIFDKPFTVATGVPKITLSGVSYPSGTLNKGALFVLRGTISANKTIQRIEIGIVKDEQWVAGHKVDQKINAKSYNILQSADSKIKFGDLGEGVYKYRCWIWIDGKRYAGFDRQFAVTAGVPKITLSGVSYPSGTLNKGALFVLRGTISANKNIQRIEIGIVKDGKWVAGHKVDQAVNAKSFNILQKADSKIKFGDLAEGNYSYRCWVWIDGKSNKVFDKQFAVTVPKIDTDFNINSNANKAIYKVYKYRSGDCYLSANTYMIKRKAVLNGSTKWNTVDNESLRYSACEPTDSDYNWMKGSYSYSNDGYTYVVKLKKLSGNKTSKLKQIKSALDAHPEGIVLWGANAGYNGSIFPHAVLAAYYKGNTLYCIDSANNTASNSTGYNTIANKGIQSYGNTIMRDLNFCTSYMYIYKCKKN